MIAAAAANLDVLKAQQKEAARTLDELQTALAKAERDLSFAVIRAPVDGVFSNRAVQTGDYVQTGQRVASPCRCGTSISRPISRRPNSNVWCPASRSRSVSTPSPNMRSRARWRAAPASGAVFSLLPPDNATGNFTKIVQRLPVRIDVPASVTAQRLLRPGMSVVVSVDTKSSRLAAAGLTSAAEAAEAAPATR